MTKDPTRQQVFELHKPTLTEEEVKKAAADGRVVPSFNTLPILIDPTKYGAIAIKWAIGTDKTETIIIDRYVAQVLLRLFSDLEQSDWTTSGITQPSGKPH